MSIDTKLLLKVLSPNVLDKAMQSFDRATLVVVSGAWIAATVMMGVATYTVTAANKIHRDTQNATALEPPVPKVDYKTVDPREVDAIVKRLKERYAGLTVSNQREQGIRISSNDGSKFREWLAALNYINAIAPSYRWRMIEMCVGKCNKDIMSADIQAQKISFKAPDPKK